MWPISSRPTVPVLRLSGPIGVATPLRPGLMVASVAGAIEKAFRSSKLPSVALSINSPGGSAVQSHLIYRRIRQLAEEHEKRVYVFCEDVAASGGYFVALAGDEIYADPSSIVGSIGVISAGFGFDRAIERLGIDRRVHTSGLSKSMLDPFLPEKAEDVARLKALQQEVHETFISIVKTRRAGKLTGADADLFCGTFWSGSKAQALGLVDGTSDLRSKMRELHGKNVRLRPIPLQSAGLLSRLRRLPEIASLGSGEGGASLPFPSADDVLSCLEARALWSRFGL